MSFIRPPWLTLYKLAARGGRGIEHRLRTAERGQQPARGFAADARRAQQAQPGGQFSRVEHRASNQCV